MGRMKENEQGAYLEGSTQKAEWLCCTTGEKPIERAITRKRDEIPDNVGENSGVHTVVDVVRMIVGETWRSSKLRSLSIFGMAENSAH